MRHHDVVRRAEFGLVDLAEVAAMLRAIAKAAPGQNAVERRLARRIEGAAVVLEVVSDSR